MKNIFTLLLLLVCATSYAQSTHKWYSTDSSTYHISASKKINGCDKVIAEKTYSKTGTLLSEWKKEYVIDKRQTCDFSAYIKTEKKYSGKILLQQSQYVSGCDDCEEVPCGTWHIFNNSGKLIETKQLGACSTAQFKKS